VHCLLRFFWISAEKLEIVRVVDTRRAAVERS